MIKKRYTVLILFVTLISLSTIGMSMGLFDFTKIYLFSEVNAIVTNKGQPVVGAEVTRTVQFRHKKYPNATTTTDAQGRFHFDALVDSSLFDKYSLSHILVWQQLHIRYQGKEYLAWDLAKSNLRSEGEFSADPEGEFSDGTVTKIPVLTCELTSEPRDIKVWIGNSLLKTICTW